MVLASTVSTGMLSKMASAYGIGFEETLTGFKWMGNRAFELAAEGWEVSFAFEEALGYMFPNVCNDKDGLTAAAIFLVAEGKWRSQDITPFEKLQQLYNAHGYHETLNTYFRSPSPAMTSALFKEIRGGNYGKGKKLGSFEILRWRDMTEGYDSDTTDNIPALPVDKATQMLTLWLDRGITFTLRGSGTEPKVKSMSQ
jgi:phosphoglucomutase